MLSVEDEERDTSTKTNLFGIEWRLNHIEFMSHFQAKRRHHTEHPTTPARKKLVPPKPQTKQPSQCPSHVESEQTFFAQLWHKPSNSIPSLHWSNFYNLYFYRCSGIQGTGIIYGSAKRIEQVQLGDLQSSANSSSITLRPTKHRAGPAEPRLQRQGSCTTYETTRNIWVMRVMGTISRSLTLKFHEMFISRSKSADFCQPRYNFPSFEPAPVVLTSHTWHLETSQSVKSHQGSLLWSQHGNTQQLVTAGCLQWP